MYKLATRRAVNWRNINGRVMGGHHGAQIHLYVRAPMQSAP
jgi:hypothetical protein